MNSCQQCRYRSLRKSEAPSGRHFQSTSSPYFTLSSWHRIGQAKLYDVTRCTTSDPGVGLSVVRWCLVKFQRRKHIGHPDGLDLKSVPLPVSDKNTMQDVLVEVWNVLV